VAILGYVISHAGGGRRRAIDAVTALDARPPSSTVVDAGGAVQPDPLDASLPEIDAAVAFVDARPVPLDAADAPRDAVGPDAGPDYKDKLEAARIALDDGDYERALVLANESIAMRHSARAYLAKADALRKLDRIELAVAAAEQAIAANPTYPPAWELKGKILWSARRYDEARPAFEQFLKLQPTGDAADTVRGLLKQ
jgi:tetratricopeptide (TPR) repeat protein